VANLSILVGSLKTKLLNKFGLNSKDIDLRSAAIMLENATLEEKMKILKKIKGEIIYEEVPIYVYKSAPKERKEVVLGKDTSETMSRLLYRNH
jgi:hypothetical protein